MKVAELPQISDLSVPEKILLVEDLWDSISLKTKDIPIPESHKEELDRRFEKNKNNPGKLLTLEELQQNIENRK